MGQFELDASDVIHTDWRRDQKAEWNIVEKSLNVFVACVDQQIYLLLVSIFDFHDLKSFTTFTLFTSN